MNCGHADGIVSKPSEGENDPEWAGTVENAFRNIRKRLDAGAEKFEGLATGFFDLDYRLQGLKAGEFVIVAGRRDT